MTFQFILLVQFQFNLLSTYKTICSSNILLVQFQFNLLQFILLSTNKIYSGCFLVKTLTAGKKKA